MALEDARDRMVDALLAEVLGRETPPDLTERICQRAFAPRVERFPWGLALTAAAALWLVAALAYLALRSPSAETAVKKEYPRITVERKPVPPPYPEPRASGEFVVEGGGTVRRGATLKTEDGKAEVHLGGYCALKLEPHSRLRINGTEWQEGVFLQQGGVNCNVVKAQGTFDVRTEIGTVSVTGTQFIVRVVPAKGEAAMTRRMWVKVLTGSVLLVGAWGQEVLAEGHERVREKEVRGMLATGVVTAKGETWIEIMTEGHKEAARYIPNWIGGLPKDGGGPDRAMVNTIRETPVGSTVKFEWRKDENMRVLRLAIIRRGEGEGRKGEGERVGEGDRPKERHPDAERPREGKEAHGDAERPKEGRPEGDAKPVQTGTTVGVVTAKGEGAIVVKADGAGEGEKYIPRWIGGMPADGGAPDRLMLKTFAGLKVGDRVKIEWLRDEHLRAVKLEPAEAAK